MVAEYQEVFEFCADEVAAGGCDAVDGLSEKASAEVGLSGAGGNDICKT